MLKPFANTARATASGPLTWRTWTGLVVVPALIVALLSWAYWSPQADHGTATAAVVNLDEPVTVDDQLVPLGRELAAHLTHRADSAYRWVLTSAEDAEAGLADGSYTAAVTIPENFSARATSVATAEPLEATQAEVTVRTSAAAGVIDPEASRQVAEATQRTLNQQVVETYLGNIYIAFGTIHDKIAEAADGAGELADGAGELFAGTRELADGADKLATGADELSTGADELDKGARELAAGAAELADGTTRLADGSAELADGLTQAERDTARLPELTRRLAEGARQVAKGNEQIADVVVPLANRILSAIDALPSATSAAEEFQRLADECESDGETGICDQLRDAADRFAVDAEQIDSVRESVRQSVVETRDSVTALAEGARKVADGNARLADSADELVAGIADAADGARRLNDGVQRTNDGAHELADGSSRLAEGTGELSNGADELSGGASELRDGTGTVRDGAGEVHNGAEELAAGLAGGKDEIPTYTDDERDHLKTVAATPSTAHGSGIDIGRSAIALFVALALWAGALATYLITRAVPSAVLTSREPTWRIIVRAAMPGATAAVLAALGLSLVLAPFLDLGLGRWLAFLGVTLLAACAFVALNQAATAIFKRPGRLASLAVLVLTAATGVVSTIPGPLYAISGVLPTHGAVLALRAIVTEAGGVTTGVIQLAVWLAIGALATVVVTDRRRFLTGKQLRSGSFLPAAT